MFVSSFTSPAEHSSHLYFLQASVPPSLESSCVVCCHLQVTSWLAVVVLFFLLLIYVLISIVFCVKCTRKTVAPTIPTSDGESSSDGENESEDMVPIAELEHR